MELEAFGSLFADAVERSFRDDAIRTAMLIDDQFPNYADMRGATDADFRETERARSIYGFMHGKGLICDVQNWRHPSDADLNLFDKVRKSDLVVLDYQLGLAGNKVALAILRHLAVSSHFNLVVLYTADASPRVALAVAAAMRGLGPARANLVPSQDALDVSEDLLAEDRFRDIDGPGLREYLTDGKMPWCEDLGAAMRAASMSLAGLRPLADHIARRWITALVGDYEIQHAPELSIGCAIDDGQPLWVHCGSCFVAIVGKLPSGSPQQEGEYLWGRLGAALRSWRPNLYRLVLSEIQNALELEAVTHHEDWLDDDLALGLGLYLLESERAARGGMPRSDIEGVAQSLIDRFVDIIRRRLAMHPRISATAIGLLGARLATTVGSAPAGEDARRIRARELAHVPAGRAVDWERKVVPRANAFMVSDEFRGSHVTTGSVLRDSKGTFWLCASPACDLVPREDGPTIVQLLRLARENTPPRQFTAGEFIAVASNGDVIILRALANDSRQPSMVPLVLPSGTRVIRTGAAPPEVRGWLATVDGLRSASLAHGFPVAGEPRREVDGAEVGHSAVESSAGNPGSPAASDPGPSAHADAEVPATTAGAAVPDTQVVEPPLLVVVSQLRTAFAMRFLAAAGQHLSRIGVDYVDS